MILPRKVNTGAAQATHEPVASRTDIVARLAALEPIHQRKPLEEQPPDVQEAPEVTSAPERDAPEDDCAQDNLLGPADFEAPDEWDQEDWANRDAALALPTKPTPSQQTHRKTSLTPLSVPTAVRHADGVPDIGGPPLPPRQAKFADRYRRVTTYLEPAIQARMLALRDAGRIQSLTQLTNAALADYLRAHYPNG